MLRRRRFLPAMLGLEKREVLSTAAPVVASAPPRAAAAQVKNTANTTGSNVAGLPESIQDRMTQIERIPIILTRYAPGRDLPADAINQIQTGMTAILAKLSPASSTKLNQFNSELRGALKNQSMPPESARELSQTFEAALESAGASQAVARQIVAGTEGVIQAGVKGRVPASVAATDYSFLLQRALQVGRPLAKPNTPHLLASDRLARGNATLSKSSQPSLQGSYAANIGIQMLDSGGNVIGTTTSDAKGNYTVQPSAALPDGKYVFTVRGVESSYLSPVSKEVKITIKTPQAHSSSSGNPLTM